MGNIPRVLLLFGPTASGKSALVNSLFSEGSYELVSADSMQAYRGMDIGTAKPSCEERARIPHHLIDILDPGDQYTAGEFVRRAEVCVHDISGRGNIPLVSGGTAFYLKNLVLGMPPAPPSDPETRRQLAHDLAERGADALHAELASLDPVSAARIHPHDAYRLTRALEVIRSSGRPLSDFFLPDGPRKGMAFLLLGIERSKDDLASRIERRVAQMFAAGLHKEVSALEAAGWSDEAPGMRAIGYAEFFSAARAAAKRVAELEAAELASIAQAIALNTRRYAKRQMTFFRSLPGVEWFQADDGAGLGRRAREWLASVA